MYKDNKLTSFRNCMTCSTVMYGFLPLLLNTSVRNNTAILILLTQTLATFSHHSIYELTVLWTGLQCRFADKSCDKARRTFQTWTFRVLFRHSKHRLTRTTNTVENSWSLDFTRWSAKVTNSTNRHLATGQTKVFQALHNHLFRLARGKCSTDAAMKNSKCNVS